MADSPPLPLHVAASDASPEASPTSDISPVSDASTRDGRDERAMKRRYEDTKRRHRGLRDPIYFIDHQVRPTCLIFRVLGTSGSDYAITFYPASKGAAWQCTCPDFSRRRRPCKHIHFVWYRVLGATEDPFFDSVTAVQDCLLAHRIGHEHLVANAHLPRPNVDDDLADLFIEHETKILSDPIVAQRPYVGENCPICYEAFTSECQVYFCESKCGNSVHQSCFQACVNFGVKSQCPYCRHDMKPAGLQQPHKLQKRRRHRY